jgi:hypothetical protein
VCLNLTVFKLGPAGGGRKGTLYLLLKAAGLMELGLGGQRLRSSLNQLKGKGGDISHNLSNLFSPANLQCSVTSFNP